MPLRVTTTQEIAAGDRLKCFFYGLPGSGKTHLAGTFPAPLFITPEKIAEELRTWGGSPLTTVIFSDVEEFISSVDEVVKCVLAGKKVGGYIPQTLIVDNITEIQNMVEHEILTYRWKEQGRKPNRKEDTYSFPNMADRDWGIMYNVLMTARNRLYTCPCHIVWIGHGKVDYRSDGDPKSRKRIEVKDINIRGQAKSFIPNSCNIMSYLEAKPVGQEGMSYYMYGRPYNGWNSRIHFPSGQSGFLRLGYDSKNPDEVHPTYDDLAPYYGLPLREECEADVVIAAPDKREESKREESVPKTESKPKPKPKRPTKTRQRKTH